MAWMKIETSVARHQKFVKAGPAPSWLWVCGLAYCQEGLTDGFIPTEALNYLGVKNPRRLSTHLVLAGLWDVVEGGWYVHDYLGHNRSASEVDAIKGRRAEAGKLGGRPRKKQNVNLVETFEVSQNESKRKTFPVDASVDASVAAAAAAVPLDVAFAEFRDAYPDERRKGGYLVEQDFLKAVTDAGGFHALMAALANHKASEQWANPRMIPGMDVWFREERWRQMLAPPSRVTVDPFSGAARAERLAKWRDIEAASAAKRAAKRS